MKPDNRNISFGQVRNIPDNVEETRTIDFILSNGIRDRHHTILNMNNWKLDNYRKNPVVGYMHDLYGNMFTAPDPDDVLGHGKDLKIEGTGKDKMLTCSVVFDPPEVNMKAEKVFRKLLHGSLRAVSVGFLEIGTGSWGTGSEAQGRENETYRFAGQELIEFSVVNIGSNPDSGKRIHQSMRSTAKGALVYLFSLLGKRYTMSQIEDMRVCNVLTLLAGKDLGLRETDPDKMRIILENIRFLENAKIKMEQWKFLEKFRPPRVF